MFSQSAISSGIPIVISTWKFGFAANSVAWKILSGGGSALDAVEKGINNAELDPKVTTVGYGGIPNQEGEVELDAMIMWGPLHSVGAVGALKFIKTPISVARKVMEKTKHTLLVGDGALQFALQEGFKKENLLTDYAKKKWLRFLKNSKAKSQNLKAKNKIGGHDTIGMVAIDKDGNICAGCSTSGTSFKLKDRVGDSPIPGAGAFVDNDIGGAAATGIGDYMMRFCLSFSVVEFMRMGLSPKAACESALKRMSEKGIKSMACLVALNKKGEFGASKLGIASFPYAIRTKNINKIIRLKNSNM